VGGDFLDFFTLTDGVIGIYLGDVRGKGLPAALYAALAVGTLRGVHKTGAADDGLEHSQPESDVARRVAALRCGPVMGVSTRAREFCESPARECWAR